mgnify:CR=1 FL=1
MYLIEKRKIIIAFVLILFPLFLYSNDLRLSLPDKTQFKYWDDKTEYKKVYHVNRSHPHASDDNEGTLDKPFLTINQAAQILKPGEKVIIHSGIYREKIIPKRGGNSAESMIAYEAAPGEKVIIKGSEIINPDWQLSIDPKSEKNDNVRTFSHKLWQVKLPDSLFAKEGNPFLIPNATRKQIKVMPWAIQWQGRIPYILSRGLIFQDSRRLTQVGIYEDLISFPGTYWVDQQKSMLHIHPFGSYNPDTSNFEITVRQQLLKPDRYGLGYIKIKGLIFEQVANGFPRIGTGTIYANNGHHWIIENNIVRQVNSVGIEVGARTGEYRSMSNPEIERKRSREHTGGFILRNNEVYACGTGGIQGHTVKHSLLKANHIHHIGWHDVERYWECAGVKWLRSEHNLLIGNHIHHIESACAIWIDWGNINTRITRNLVHDIAPNNNGAIFVEASKVPNLVDHNIIWNADCIAISLFDTDNALVMHNLIARTQTPVAALINTDRSLNDEKLTSKNNVIKNNIFYNLEELPNLESKKNICNYNIYIDSEERLDLDQWFKNWESQGYIKDITLDYNPVSGELKWDLDSALPRVPANDIIEQDFNFMPRKNKSTPGPFNLYSSGRVIFKLDKIYQGYKIY